MDDPDPDHAAAARRFAAEATGEVPGDNPAVLAALAQAEALLAVAAAIDGLTAVLRERSSPPPLADGPAYRVVDVRREHPNAYQPWAAEDDAALLAAHHAGHSVAALAGTFGRKPSAIRSRLNHLGAGSTNTGATSVTAGEGTDPPT